MRSTLKIQLTKPVPILHRDLEVNGRKLFKAMGKAIADTAFGNWNNVALDAMDFGAALGLAKTEGDLAWQLVYRALGRGMIQLVTENKELIGCDFESLERVDLCDHLDFSLGDTELFIDAEFFSQPKQSLILKVIRLPFEKWLQSLVPDAVSVKNMSVRLPTYFVNALHEEWVKHRTDYAALLPPNTPFNAAVEREQGWARYGACLQKHIEEPIFLETFGLKQVYVRSCAYYVQEPKPQRDAEFERSKLRSKKSETRVVVELWNILTNWLESGDRTDAIRVISGGPGCGKSSFTKMFAAHVAETMDFPVLYIPLHHFNPRKDLIEAVGEFVQFAQFLPHNPLASKVQEGEQRVFILFDGLDELAMQGNVGAEVAQSFVGEVQRTVNQFNLQQTRLQVLLSGRELVVQASSDLFRKSGQILHFLPYFVPEDERNTRSGTEHTYLDEHNLLATDRRQEWWQLYGTASGLGYTHMPQELDQGNLTEITAQPLLNYLVALSYQQDKLDITPESNLNEIYQYLLNAVYKRGWAGKDARHPAIANITQPNFERILEEVALASWHGDGRTTTVKEIEAHCQNSGLKELLEGFQEGAKSGVIRLLTAFYFRQSGQRDGGDRTFEFTHKSFGEYLTARRLVRGLQRINQELENRKANFDCGWDEKQALVEWAELSGPSRIDADLFKFLLDEVQFRHRKNPELVAQWQQNLCRLIKVMSRHGMPMEKLPFATFHEANHQARNAEEALLVTLNACARCTRVVSQFKWDKSDHFGNWLARLQYQSPGNEKSPILNHLSFLDLSGCDLRYRDLCWANLDGANLFGVNLEGATLEGADLFGADLFGADLFGVNLFEATLEGANLCGATLEGANLCGATLERANLDGTNLDGATLCGVDLSDISWNEETSWDNVVGLDGDNWDNFVGLGTAKNVPNRLKKQLGIA
jgi:uncharacterized protein YjbI with pentapeptide repeats